MDGGLFHLRTRLMVKVNNTISKGYKISGNSRSLESNQTK